VRGVSTRKGVGCMLAVAVSSWSVPLRARGQCQEGCRMHVAASFLLVLAAASRKSQVRIDRVATLLRFASLYGCSRVQGCGGCASWVQAGLGGRG
jgi:hypothetical protein